MLWEQELMSVTMTSRDITYFLGSRDVRKWFKHLVRVNCEYICPDPAWASICSQRYFRTNPSVQNVFFTTEVYRNNALYQIYLTIFMVIKKKFGTVEEAKTLPKIQGMQSKLKTISPVAPACMLFAYFGFIFIDLHRCVQMSFLSFISFY